MNHTQGFTLVEIIIVVAIITSTLVVGVSGYSAQVSSSQLRSDASILVDDLERTKQSLLSREVLNGSCTTLNGFTVVFTANSNVYTVTRNCSNMNLQVKSQELTSTIFHTGTVGSVTFTVPYAQVSATSQIIIRHPTGKQCISIQVPMIGPVSNSDPYSC